MASDEQFVQALATGEAALEDTVLALIAEGLQARTKRDWGISEAAGVALVDIAIAEPIRVQDPPWNRKKYGFDWDGKPC